MNRSSLVARGLRRGSLAVAACLGLGLAAASCGQPADTCKPGVSSTVVSGRLTYNEVIKIDLLLSIDNSRSMADKQAILALAVPDLVRGLVNPPCVDVATGEVDSVPDGPLASCPQGTERKSEPALDIHVGIISSSLGGHGSDACSTAGAGKASNNDEAHLLVRIDPETPGEVETYQNLKFLAWDPAQLLTPPGEADIEADTTADSNASALIPSLADMVIGVGQVGCGYEAQLESWYRFLVDPSPPENVTLDSGDKVLLEGIDKVLLDQRRAFLRPDSFLAIVMLSDENDCSIRESGQFYFAAQQKTGSGSPFHLPKGRAICETDPNDDCCFSCGQPGPKDDNGNPICADDPSCKNADGTTVYLDELTDNINVRCFDQKRRFGINFLYPIDRYVNALSQTTVTDRNGNVVPNPIFSDLDTSDSNGNTRTSGQIFLAGIVGVPWQDIARFNANGVPDLLAGLDPEGKPRGGFKNADELFALLPGQNYDTWGVILGDPSKYPSALPRDPLMMESIDPRAGTNPITGDALVTSAQPLGNAINGHEWTISKRDDLQFACIFPLSTARDCTVPQASCDCEDPMNDSPLCAVNPATGSPTDQVYAKAYPGLRELQVLKEVGSRGIVASICPAQVDDPASADFGYRQAITAILDRFSWSGEGGCFQPTLTADAEGRVACLVVEATDASDAAACNACGFAAREPLTGAQQGAADAIQADYPGLSFNCFCEVTQLSGSKPGEPLWTCQNDPATAPVTDNGETVDGYCYIDANAGVGNPDIVQKCADDERRLLRLLGAAQARPGATLFLTCENQEPNSLDPSCGNF